MAVTLVINKEFSEQVMSHGDVRAKALKDHTQEELLSLAIQAKSSNNPVLTRCFTDLPSLVVLQGDKVETEQAKVVPPPVIPTTTKKATIPTE